MYSTTQTLVIRFDIKATIFILNFDDMWIRQDPGEGAVLTDVIILPVGTDPNITSLLPTALLNGYVEYTPVLSSYEGVIDFQLIQGTTAEYKVLGNLTALVKPSLTQINRRITSATIGDLWLI